MSDAADSLDNTSVRRPLAVSVYSSMLIVVFLTV